MFDLIIGVESLQRFGVILNFGEDLITIDQITTPMQPLKRFMRSTKKIFNSSRDGENFLQLTS